MKKKKTLSDASHATISTSAPTVLQKGRNFPNHKRGKKKIKKERKKPSKVVGAAAPWNLFFFSLVAICAKKSKNPTTSVPPDSASIPQIGSRGQAEMVRLPSL